MNQCSKCNVDLTGQKIKTGTSKKTGKQWSAIFCPQCKEPNWVKGVTAATALSSTNSQNNREQKGDLWTIYGKLADIENKIDVIMKNMDSSNNYSVGGWLGR